MNSSLQEISNQLKRANKIAIVCHARPDGDALGSGMGLCLALNNVGKQAYMLCEEPAPAKFDFLAEIKQIYSVLPCPVSDFDLLISVDCADASRMGAFAYDFSRFRGSTLNIDHHVSNTSFAKYNYVINCSATCEIIPEVLDCANIQITQAAANFLMLGLITDSGNFTHQDVSEKTFSVAARLRALGADVSGINYNMFQKQPLQRALLYARVISKMLFDLDGRVAFLPITEEDMKATGADRTMTEGFVDFPLTIIGTEVAVSIMETGKYQYKVSMRSKCWDVSEIASKFGGGGHMLASGCMMFGELGGVIQELTETIAQAISTN